jgi:hypothetical protein
MLLRINGLQNPILAAYDMCTIIETYSRCTAVRRGDKCPMWVEGVDLHGAYHRKSLRTTSWDIAERMVRDMQLPPSRPVVVETGAPSETAVPAKPERFTFEHAKTVFLTNIQAENRAADTLRKYQLMFRQMGDFASLRRLSANRGFHLRTLDGLSVILEGKGRQHPKQEARSPQGVFRFLPQRRIYRAKSNEAHQAGGVEAHRFRHTAAVDWLASGLTLEEVAALLGAANDTIANRAQISRRVSPHDPQTYVQRHGRSEGDQPAALRRLWALE